MKNFLRRNWNVKLTVVFMMPVPWVRMELATCRILIVFRNLFFDDFCTKIWEMGLGVGGEKNVCRCVAQ